MIISWNLTVCSLVNGSKQIRNILYGINNHARREHFKLVSMVRRVHISRIRHRAVRNRFEWNYDFNYNFHSRALKIFELLLSISYKHFSNVQYNTTSVAIFVIIEMNMIFPFDMFLLERIKPNSLIKWPTQ